MRRRRYRQPYYQRLWEQVSVEHKRRLYSYSWSTSVHFLALVLLVYCTFAIEDKRPLILQVSFSAAEDDLPISFETLDVPTPVLQEIETPAEPPPLEFPILAEIALPTTGPELAEVITASATELSSDGDSNDVRIVEVSRRVKASGGETEGPVRTSLIWNSDDDIDLHVSYRSLAKPTSRIPFVEQGYIWFGQPISSHARLDVDANANPFFLMPNPACENVIFNSVPKKATFLVSLNLFAWRSRRPNIPYIVTVHYGRKSKVFEGTIGPGDGMKQIHQFSYP